MRKPLVFLLLLLLLAVCTAAAGEAPVFDAATGTITAWQTEATSLILPDAVDGVPVTAVGEGAFCGCTTLESVTFPPGLAVVSQEAFAGCEALIYLVFQGETLPALATDAFSGCPLTDVDLPWNATRAAAEAAQALFDGFGFEAKVWRGNVPGLELPTEGYLYEKTGKKGYYSLNAYTGDQTALYPHYYLIQEDGRTLPVVGLGEGVFRGNTQLKRFGVPHSDRFVTIGREAFADSSLEWIDLYDSLSEIGDRAFQNCTALTSVALTSSLHRVGSGAFSGCTGLTELILGCDTDILPRNVFQDCTALTTLSVASEEITKELFANLPITTLTLSEDVEVIGEGAFRGTQLKTLVLPEGIRRVNSEAFADCATLETVTVQCNASALSPDAFDGCTALKTVVLTKGSVPASFLANSTVQVLTLGEQITHIGENAFANAPLTGVVLPATVELSQGAFSGVAHSSIRIEDAAGADHIEALEAKLNRPWYMPLLRVSDTDSTIAMPPLPATLEGFRFDRETGTIQGYDGSAATVVVPAALEGYPVLSVASLAPEEGLPSPVQTVILPETVHGIGQGAFTACTRLETLLCFGPLDLVDEAAFQGCQNLETVWLLNGVHTIGASAFDGCTGLSRLWWPSTACRIGEYAFRGTALGDFSLSVNRIGVGAFQHCTQLEQVHLRPEVTRLETLAFDGCTELETLRIGFTDSEIFYKYAKLGSVAPDVEVLLPAEINAKQLQSMYRALSAGNGGPLESRDDILLADCAQLLPPAPELEALLGSLFP